MAAGLEVADVGAETADGAVHDVAGDALNSSFEVFVALAVERAVIDFAIVYVGIVLTLFDVGKVIRVISENAADQLERVRRVANGIWHVKPTGAEVIMPLTPGHPVVVVGGEHGHAEAELAKVVNAGCAVGFVFGFGQSREEQGSEDGDDGNDDEEFDQSKSASAGAAKSK